MRNGGMCLKVMIVMFQKYTYLTLSFDLRVKYDLNTFLTSFMTFTMWILFFFSYTCETQAGAGAGVESCGAWFMITRMCMQTHAVHNSLHTHSTCCSAVGRSVIHRSHLSPSINHPSIIITIIITSVTTVSFIVAIMIITVPAVTRLVCALLWLSPALWHALFSLTAVWFNRSASVFLGPQVKTGPPAPLPPLPPSLHPG